MSSPQQESFQSLATVFILQEKTWIERGHGLVRFVFDLRTFALRLVIRPETPEEFECKLRPRIRSKGPRAYVVRAQADNGIDEHILAVRFEREEDSRSFRRFVEKRDVDHNAKGTISSQANYNAQHRDYSNPSGVQPQGAYHRAQGRGGNVAPQGGGGGGGGGYYASNLHHAGYSNLMGSGNPYSAVSPPSKGGHLPHGHHHHGGHHQHGHQVQANYFWTCSRCLQMVDPTLHSCHVCGTPRQSNPSSGVLSQISPNAAYPNQVGSPYPAQAGAVAVHHGMAPQQLGSGQHLARYGPAAAKASHPTVLKLTSVNLEKHNKLFPPKRRNVKEIIIVQIDWLRKHGQLR